MELNERKRRILRTIIDDYISSAMPVGSKTIAEQLGMRLSSATIRNEMSELEELGYLEQPHTSAGRIPSDKAYRIYVDQLMEIASLSAEDAEYIKGYYDERMHETQGILEGAAKAISNATDYVSLIMPPQLKSVAIKHIQLVPVSDRAALAVVVTDAGIIKDTPLILETAVTASQLEDASHLLNKIFAGKRISEGEAGVSDIYTEIQGQREIFTQITDFLTSRFNSGYREILIGGAAKLLAHPEYATDLGAARNMLQLLDSKEQLRDILLEQPDMEIRVRIGTENQNAQIKDCSVVTATYRMGGRVMGRLGVIGPVRMNYGRVLQVMKYMSASLSEVLSAATGIHPEKDNKKDE